MYSEKDPKEVQDFMKELGFPSLEKGDIYNKLIEKFKGKEVTIRQGDAKVVGELHSGTIIFGDHLNLIKLKKEECTPGVLEELRYYDPQNFKPELGHRNFGFVSAAFKEDPETTDLLVIPTDGSIFECEGEKVQL